MKNIFDTSLPDHWSTKLNEDFFYDLNGKYFDMIANVLFTATSEILNNAKTKDRPVAMVFEKLNKQFIAAAICQYFENEDTTQPGNYSLVWTYYEEDIPENVIRITLDNINTHSYYSGVAGSKYNFRFSSSDCLCALVTTTLSEIKKWLDENAKENEEVGVEVPGVFEARVAVENGVKVFALNACGEIKALIKNDSSIEK